MCPVEEALLKNFPEGIQGVTWTKLNSFGLEGSIRKELIRRKKYLKGKKGKGIKSIMEGIISNISSTSTLESNGINLFYQPGTRSTNDAINKKRESILCKLGNNEIEEEWFHTDERWNQVNTELKRIIDELKPDNCPHYKFVSRGGRKYNYDFEIHYHSTDGLIKTCNMEFKYGATEVSDCPQWCSPMHPSQYFNMSYEEYFYGNYLPKLCGKYDLPIPNRETYLKEIGNNKPPCMEDLQTKYYRGAKKSSRYTGDQEDIDNYNYAKQLNNESIKKFLELSTFNVDTMNNYLKETQEGKIYLLWNNGSFNIRTRSHGDYQINPDTIEIKNGNCLCGTTLSGCRIKMLLRFKNGVAYPGLQIS